MPNETNPRLSRSQTREQNIQTALRMPEMEAVEALLKITREDKRQRQQRENYMGIATIAAFLGFVSLLMSYPMLAMLSGGFCVIIAMSFINRSTEKSSCEPAVITALGQVKDAGAILPLCSLLRAVELSESIRFAAADTLARILAPLAAQEKIALNAETKKRLFQIPFVAAAPNYYPYERRCNLLVPILRIVEKTGEKSDLFRLYFLTRMTAFTPKMLAIRDAAQAAFAAIEARTDYGAVAAISRYLEEGLMLTGETAIDEGTMLRRQALIRLLPQITPENAGLIAPKDYERLYQLTKYACEQSALFGDASRYPAALLGAVIEMAQRLEDTRALEMVRYYAQADAPTADNQTLRLAARRALPILRTKAEREKTGATLLRASAAPIGAETLLRPAAAKPDSGPETLLRPAP